jgi:hypothetical protein
MSEYTANMTKAITEAAPLTFEAAVALAERDEFIAAGKSHRSIIAKAKSMGVEYVPKAPAAKRPKGVTKASLVAEIAAGLNVAEDSLTGLDKANMAALQTLVKVIGA